MPSIADLGMGKVGKNDHPLHPSAVHLPIAFLLTASSLTILGHIARVAPGIVAPVTGILSMGTSEVISSISSLGYISNVAGIITALPAINSGLFEGYGIYKSRGANLADSVVKTTLIHAALNDVAIFAAAYNWWTMRDITGYVPSTTNVIVSGFIFGGIVFSAYLGGSLVYKHGVGVQRMGEGKDIKETKLAEERSRARKEL